jgi:hypothetical protein
MRDGLIIIAAIILFFVSTSIYKALNFNGGMLNEISNINIDGYALQHNITDPSVLSDLWKANRYRDIYDSLKNDKKVLDFVHSTLSDDYIIMDYIMFLSNSVLHTCHRDNNGSRFNDIEHKSYTMIIYVDDMDRCLDVIPRSHNHLGWYKTDTTKSFMCKPGSIILFDSDLIHSGSLNEDTTNNRRIQMKVCHKDDVKKLDFYSDYYKILDKKNTNSDFSKKIQKHFTCTYPVFADFTQGSNKDYISGNISGIEKVFSQLFYSNKDYYKLKDAF